MKHQVFRNIYKSGLVAQAYSRHWEARGFNAQNHPKFLIEGKVKKIKLWQGVRVGGVGMVAMPYDRGQLLCLLHTSLPPSDLEFPT